MLEPTVRHLWDNLTYLAAVLELPLPHCGMIVAALAAAITLTVVMLARRAFS